MNTAMSTRDPAPGSLSSGEPGGSLPALTSALAQLANELFHGPDASLLGAGPSVAGVPAPTGPSPLAGGPGGGGVSPSVAAAPSPVAAVDPFSPPAASAPPV